MALRIRSAGCRPLQTKLTGPSTDTVGITCHSPAVRTALQVLRTSKAPSVALYCVECTLLRGFDSFRAHQPKDLKQITYMGMCVGDSTSALASVSVPCPYWSRMIVPHEIGAITEKAIEDNSGMDDWRRHPVSR